jgi:transglutaminase-like putative cysteine protease
LGVLILALSGEFLVAQIVAFLFALAIGPQVVIRRHQNLIGNCLNVFAVLSGLFFGYLAFSTSNFLYYTLFYAMLLSGVKGFFLFQRNDFMQFYVLSFLQCIAGAVINPGLSFGILIIPYVVGLTLCLLMSNVRKWVEGTWDASMSKMRNEDDVRSWLRSRNLLPAQFLWLTVGLSVATFVVSVIFFFLFPRVGMGFFAYQQRPAVSMPGFAETVELGAMTDALDDTQVVMRVKTVEGDLEPPVRMRGQSLDFYDGQKWSKTTSTVWPLRTDQQNRFLVEPRAPLDGSERTVEVYLEPISGSKHILFAPQTPVAFEPPPNDLRALRPEKWRFYKDAAGDVVVTGPPNVALLYYAHYADNRVMSPLFLSPALRKDYLELPPGLSQQIAVLAREVAGDARSPEEIASRLVQFFHTQFRYSLRTRHDESDPLADFLLRNREGHCEYFASGMVVMLRVLGIPARIVTGFYGGDRNEYGNYIALRKSDAHSWVEVFVEGKGFVTFDPTPPSFIQARLGKGLFAGLSKAIDAVRLFWYRWVVEYSLDKQMDFLLGLAMPSREKSGFAEPRITIGEIRDVLAKAKDLPWALVFFGLVATVLVLWTAKRLFRGKGILRRLQHIMVLPEVATYRLALKIVSKRTGLRRARHETQIEFAQRVGGIYPQVLKPLLAVTWVYLCAMFGRCSGTLNVSDLKRLVEEVQRGLKTSKRLQP